MAVGGDTVESDSARRMERDMDVDLRALSARDAHICGPKNALIKGIQ